MAKTLDEKIESVKAEIEQLRNREKQLWQQHKAQERKDRTRRLCQRIGLFESLLPESITLTDEHFKSFLEKTILSESAKRLLSELSVRSATAAAPIRAGAAAQPAPSPPANPSNPARQGGASGGANNGGGEAVTA
jgi:TolA-binding protein